MGGQAFPVELLGQLQGLALCREIRPGDALLILQVPIFGIVAGQFRGQHDPGFPVILGGGIGLRSRGFELAAEPAEHIDFPNGVESAQEEVERPRPLTRERQQVVHPCSDRIRRDAREKIGPVCALLRSGLLDPAVGDLQVQVAGTRRRHQSVELRIVEHRPPGHQCFRRNRPQRGGAIAGRGPTLWRHRIGWPVVGPDHAAGQDCEQREG